MVHIICGERAVQTQCTLESNVIMDVYRYYSSWYNIISPKTSTTNKYPFRKLKKIDHAENNDCKYKTFPVKIADNILTEGNFLWK